MDVLRRFHSVLLISLPLATACAADGSSPGLRDGTAVESVARAPDGRVHAQGKVLADDRGPFLAVGATLFWALWGEAHDADRLDRNLAWLAERQFDYVRILGMVGTESWQDRRIDPRDPAYWETVDRLLARLERHGLRAQVTVFADAQVMMPDPTDRSGFADAWARFAEAHADRILLLETANEYWQNGLGADEVRDLTGRMNALTGVLVAASTPRSPWPDGGTNAAGVAAREAAGIWQLLYGGADANAVTYHFDRAPGSDGAWRQVRLPWQLQFTDIGLPEVWVNNEPIGPQSSVAADDDPVRLALGAAVNWISGLAAYTLHTGAGIRGGGAADLERGRVANIWETPRLVDTARLLAGVRHVLPSDLPNWERLMPGDAGHPCPAGGDRAFAARRDGEFVLVVVRPEDPVDCDFRPGVRVAVYRPPFTSESSPADLDVAVVRGQER